MDTLVRIATKADVAVITIDNPPANVLSSAVCEQLGTAFDRAARDPEVRVIAVTGAGRAFMAGADIKELQQVALGRGIALPDYHKLLGKIEDSTKPVVMAIRGAALGGGNELAMAGHYRVASPDAQFGQPEVNLGLIPGAEGTQRLPRLVGPAMALDLCISGKSIGVVEALQAGLIDRVVEGDLIEGAVELARERRMRKTRERDEKLTGDGRIFDHAREQAHSARPHWMAPLKVVDAIEAAVRLSFEEGSRREQELFQRCIHSDQARALLYIFFAERGASKIPDLPFTGHGDVAFVTAAPNSLLIEIGRDRETGRDAIVAALATVKKQGKVGVVVAGAVGERVIGACRREAESLVEEGVTTQQVNRALTDFGMAYPILFDDDGGSESNDIANVEIVGRCLRAMANEGKKISEEGHVWRAADIDVILVSGYGFPRYRGGPMWCAEQ